MRKCCHKHCRAIQATIKNKSDVKKVNNFEKSFAVREKRIGIVFKVIYVIAIFFAAIFLEMAKTFGNGFTNIYILETCAASFLLVMIGYMVFYIVNEMKCLKLNIDELSEKQIDTTENSYSKIFISLYISGFVSILCTGVSFDKFNDLINQDMLIRIIFGIYVIWWFIFVVQKMVKNKVVNIVLQGISCIAVTILIISMLLLPALNTVA